MRQLLFIVIMIPIFAVAQKPAVLIRLSDAGGKQINGDAMIKGFERQLQANTMASGGKNNTQFSFTMNITGAAADLKKAMTNGDILMNGMVSVLQPPNSDGALKPAYTIKMEKIKVLACAETMGCNGITNTTVTLLAARIGWTYYQYGLHGGAQAVSNKYGYDAETGAAWTNF